MYATERFYPARYHVKGPGEWMVVDRTEDKVMWVHGKGLAHMFAILLNACPEKLNDESFLSMFRIAFERQDDGGCW